jgi:predicted RNase H-like HicB family nuclease
MLDLRYSLVIEATKDPVFFGFYSPDLPGFSGVGHSVEDCLYQAKWAMEEHVSVLQQEGLPVPSPNPNPTVLVQNDPRTLSSAAAD